MTLHVHCRNGHLLAGANLYTESSGQRKCRSCQKARQDKHRDSVNRVRMLEGARQPTAGELTRMLAAGRSYRDLAREFGVSDVAIRRSAQKLGLSSTRARTASSHARRACPRRTVPVPNTYTRCEARCEAVCQDKWRSSPHSWDRCEKWAQYKRGGLQVCLIHSQTRVLCFFGLPQGERPHWNEWRL